MGNLKTPDISFNTNTWANLWLVSKIFEAFWNLQHAITIDNYVI